MRNDRQYDDRQYDSSNRYDDRPPPPQEHYRDERRSHPQYLDTPPDSDSYQEQAYQQQPPPMNNDEEDFNLVEFAQRVSEDAANALNSLNHIVEDGEDDWDRSPHEGYQEDAFRSNSVGHNGRNDSLDYSKDYNDEDYHAPRQSSSYEEHGGAPRQSSTYEEHAPRPTYEESVLPRNNSYEERVHQTSSYEEHGGVPRQERGRSRGPRGSGRHGGADNWQPFEEEDDEDEFRRGVPPPHERRYENEFAPAPYSEALVPHAAPHSEFEDYRPAPVSPLRSPPAPSQRLPPQPWPAPDPSSLPSMHHEYAAPLNIAKKKKWGKKDKDLHSAKTQPRSNVARGMMGLIGGGGGGGNSGAKKEPREYGRIVEEPEPEEWNEDGLADALAYDGRAASGETGFHYSAPPKPPQRPLSRPPRPPLQRPPPPQRPLSRPPPQRQPARSDVSRSTNNSMPSQSEGYHHQPATRKLVSPSPPAPRGNAPTPPPTRASRIKKRKRRNRMLVILSVTAALLMG
eukprot:CAMPEP_0194413086 /NCGR_PEP_ID=MMETSP0176-20130528/11589_1 /TAXON_ID=216777 /ORGANISM="Proboscia alata, Strain PI-D3" /LENGTH=510 /DNA_ID=CAMNT_0039216229 /DNA_START=67 /DNA_END=1595 /DNA_ORIENTATION=+